MMFNYIYFYSTAGHSPISLSSWNFFFILNCGDYVKGITLDVFLPAVLVSTGVRTPVPSE